MRAPAVALLFASITAAADVDARALYDAKCLFCHSAEVAQRPRLKPAQWRRLVESMRARAPMLISRGDADVLTRYIVRELKLLPRSAPVEIVKIPEATPGEAAIEPAPLVEASLPPEPSDPEAEALGPELLEARCSKCHTLQRVYLKLIGFERASAIISRMKRKTGSGITDADAELLQRFLRSRL
jgi:cytochrome c5